MKTPPTELEMRVILTRILLNNHATMTVRRAMRIVEEMLKEPEPPGKGE